MAPPFGTTEVDIMFNKGISHFCSRYGFSGVIQHQKFLVCLEDKKIGQGRENVQTCFFQIPCFGFGKFLFAMR